jgi:D-alanyl-D-alanine carboxypeptidase
MLGLKGYTPVKTGFTEVAGPCLVTACSSEQGHEFVVALLNSRDMDSRWLETQ